MKRIMKGAIKFALIRTLEHHREIFAVFPMVFTPSCPWTRSKNTVPGSG